MKAKALSTAFREASLVGEVAADRRSYVIFEGPKYYLVTTLSTPLSGNFTLVDKRAVDYVRRRFGGAKNMTSGELLRRIKKPAVRNRFDALYILYVLEALGQASRRKAKLPARGFLFNLRKPRHPRQ
jgi:hypothetical protein